LGLEVVRVRRKRMVETRTDRCFLIAVYVFLGFTAAVILYPMIYVVSASFSSSTAVINNQVWLWPVDVTLAGYRAIIEYQGVATGFFNSIIYTGGTVILSLTLTILMAYPISRPNLPGRRLVIWALLIALVFNGGLIPFYLVVKDLGLLNTRLSQILPAALNVWLIILAKTFFQHSIPPELYEAAQIDGASNLGFLWRLVLPLSKPIIAVIVLITAVTTWNSYFYALIFLNSPNLYPLQLVLRQILVLNQATLSGFGAAATNPLLQQQLLNMQTLMKYALIVVTSVPMVALYPLTQRYFISGIMVGSLKE
jgi:putative aldouronate transport system permease protein